MRASASSALSVETTLADWHAAQSAVANFNFEAHADEVPRAAAIVLRLAASTGDVRSSMALRGDSRNKGNGIVVAGGGAVFVGGEYAGEAAFGSPPLRSDRRAPDGFVARLSS